MRLLRSLFSLLLLNIVVAAQADVIHEVAPGETLATIAARYGVTVEAIKAANPKAQKYVFTSMKLTIPTNGAASTPAASSRTQTTSTTATSPVVAPAPAPTASKPAPAASAPAPAATTAAPAPVTGAVQPNAAARASAKENSLCVEYGELSAFRTSGAASLQVDYSQCLVEGKQSVDQYLAAKGGDWVRDWPKESANAHNQFCVFYNHKLKGCLELQYSAGSPYTIVIRPEWIDFGDVGSQFNPFASTKAGGCVMRGTITLYGPQGQSLCQLYANDVKGIGNFNFESRLSFMYRELGTRLRKMIKD